MAHIGKEQLAVFNFTIVATLATDLLIGILAGTLLKLIINVVLFKSAMRTRPDAEKVSTMGIIYGFFQSPVFKREMIGDELHLHFDKPLVCFNSTKLSNELENIPSAARSIVIHLNDKVRLIDHTSCENLMQSVASFTDNQLPVTVLGLNNLKARSHYPAAARVGTGLAPTS
jgi:MFS superfamily sulfate permease-like transporter